MKLVPLIGLLSVLLRGGTPLFETDVWPGEGRPIFEAASANLSLHEVPSPSSGIFRAVIVARGQRLQFDDTRYQTVQAGRIRARTPAKVTGRLMGIIDRISLNQYYSAAFPPANFELKSGTEFEYLQDRAEGTCFVRIKGKVIEASPCPADDKSTFDVETKPKTEWWIHVALGNSVGWLLVVDSSVKVVERE